jgi:hypothetical protein
MRVTMTTHPHLIGSRGQRNFTLQRAAMNPEERTLELAFSSE